MGSSPQVRIQLKYLVGSMLSLSTGDGPALTQLNFSGGQLLDYEVVYGMKPTKEELESRLRPLSPRHLLNIITYITIQLGKERRFDDARLNEKLVRQFFPNNYEHVLESCVRRQKESGSAFVVVFSEAMIITAVKAIGLYCDESNIAPLADLQVIGDLFLILNDLTDFLGNEENDTPESKLLSGLASIITFYRSDDLLHGIARSYILFMDEKNHLKGKPTYIDLKERITKVVGIDADFFWTLMFAIYGRIGSLENNKDNIYFNINYEEMYKKYNVTDAELSSFKLFMVQSYSEWKVTCRREYEQSFRLFHFLSLSKNPIIDFGDAMFSPSIHLVEDKLKDGLYHLLIDKSLSPKERSIFQSYFGEVFSDYIRTIFRGFLKHKQYIDVDTTPLKSDEHKCCDAIINYGSSLIVMEYKSSPIPNQVRIGSPKAFREWVEKTYIESAEQIITTIRLIESGALIKYGIDPANIQYYYPLVVTYDNAPMFHPIYDYIMSHIRENLGYPVNRKEIFFQFICSSEIEDLPQLKIQGHDFLDLIIKKMHSEFISGSFRNHWSHSGIIVKAKNSKLLDAYNRITNQAIRSMKKRGKVVRN